ncbi:3' terminal RNA ribose 2'-O-methyltransferase Hen1 [Bradyrhizobium erythrophlei]|uniref:3' terminal RNA ribose 2'-O-methyltransferase Hen1 n=1 Tax=Bradyrhizobium erythrophlei TaxID=1437360 RepID=UPI0035E724E1
MFLSIATTHQPATDLGFLLHKHPDRIHEVELAFGKALILYPEAVPTRCEVVLVLDVDPVGLVRGKGNGEGLLDQYVNDRPYAASSFLSVALNRAFRTAMAGTCHARQELANEAIPLEAVVTPLPMRGGEKLVRALFEPLGWHVEIEPIEGPGATGNLYARVKLGGTARLSSLLNHLYVLIPVMDDAKHYWVGDDEIDKLLNRGEGWLSSHPAKELIVRRYLRHRGMLARAALERLVPETQDESAQADPRGAQEEVLEAPIRLNDQRMDAVVDALRATRAKTIADLGCGEGKLLQRLLREPWAQRLIGLDPASRALEWAARRLKLNMAGGPPEGRVTLLHGSLTYRDERWSTVDAAALVEVIEHLDPDRLPLVERVVFGGARPRAVVVTTPNADYNRLFPNLADGGFRHPDHRFEWTRAEFRSWTEKIASTYGYQPILSGIGQQDDAQGAPTQMAVFTR